MLNGNLFLSRGSLCSFQLSKSCIEILKSPDTLLESSDAFIKVSKDLSDFIHGTLLRVCLLICDLSGLLNKLIKVCHSKVVEQERPHILVIAGF